MRVRDVLARDVRTRDVRPRLLRRLLCLKSRGRLWASAINKGPRSFALEQQSGLESHKWWRNERRWYSTVCDRVHPNRLNWSTLVPSVIEVYFVSREFRQVPICFADQEVFIVMCTASRNQS